MRFDLFFSVSHTDPHITEQQVLKDFLIQVKAAEELGFKRTWIAESHLSSQSQKKNQKPVIPHWHGEVGLQTDFFQTLHFLMSETSEMEFGSAILNLLANGGPVAQAERLAYFLTLMKVKGETRKIHLGISSGRFDFMLEPYGIYPKNNFEQKYWPHIKNQIFAEGCEIFFELFKKNEIHSEKIKSRYLVRHHFQTEEEWQKALDLYDVPMVQNKILLEKFYQFQNIKLVPSDYDGTQVDFYIGSHDPYLQNEVNQYWPVRVFNLSITSPEKIEETHLRMTQNFHERGGPWKREFMPRTTFVFINADKDKSPSEQSLAAHEAAKIALSAYWLALDGTLSTDKVKEAAMNALIGNPEEIITQIHERFHEEDCLMLWFDFFNHDCKSVIKSMTAFAEHVAPKFDENNWSNRIDFIQR